MDRVMVLKDDAGEWRWKIVAPNNRIIDASSEGFSSIESAKRNLLRCGHKLPEPLRTHADASLDDEGPK